MVILKNLFKISSLAILLFFSCWHASICQDAETVYIPILTESHTVLLQTDRQKRLITVYHGQKLNDDKEYESIGRQYRLYDNNIGVTNAAYTPAGTWNLSEPAIQVTHSDGNTSLELHYVSHQTRLIDSNVALTEIILRDPVYPFEVRLCYKAFQKENVIEQWTEISHKEKKAVKLEKFSSANLYFTDGDFFLTSYHNLWAHEMQPSEVKLERGTRTIESKLGARAMLLESSSFLLSFGGPVSEDHGHVIIGHLGWSGNFKLEFEVDAFKNLRLLAGINPYASEYYLEPGITFKTPPLIYAMSDSGTGPASRGLHDWARKYKILDGQGSRLTLLNNWEATYFDFDEKKIASLFKDATSLGVDLFLLDDGWFGNKYPRNSDRAGLGDWQENVNKLPNGIGYLVSQAEKEGVKFGIWIEPEMVNPKSELYEKHLDWVIRQPERPEVYFRNQLVLDLANPEVQDFVFNVVDRLFTENPKLAFIKWDCNSVIYNAHSAYLEKKGIPQSHLYVEYVRGLHDVLEMVRQKYPTVPMMLCSGGGGRVDYEMLQYFTEFWPSDNTDPLERVFMQWDYSYFFPSIATDCHVTNWGDQSLKYKVDIASMGKLGFDIVGHELSENDLIFAKEAVSNYHRFKDIVWHGDLFRLVNPYSNEFASLMYVSKDQGKAIVFNYLVNQRLSFHTSIEPVKFKGLDAQKHYRVKEINLYPGSRSRINDNETYSGDFLMKAGINLGIGMRNPSIVLEISEVN